MQDSVSALRSANKQNSLQIFTQFDGHMWAHISYQEAFYPTNSIPKWHSNNIMRPFPSAAGIEDSIRMVNRRAQILALQGLQGIYHLADEHWNTTILGGCTSTLTHDSKLNAGYDPLLVPPFLTVRTWKWTFQVDPTQHPPPPRGDVSSVQADSRWWPCCRPPW